MTQLADLGGWPAVLQQLVSGRDLPSSTARAAMDQVLARAYGIAPEPTQ